MPCWYISLLVSSVLLRSVPARPRHSKRIIPSSSVRGEFVLPPVAANKSGNQSSSSKQESNVPVKNLKPGPSHNVIPDKKLAQSEKKPDPEKTNYHDHDHVPPKGNGGALNPIGSYMVTRRPAQQVETTTFYTESTASTSPPWHKKFVSKRYTKSTASISPPWHRKFVSYINVRPKFKVASEDGIQILNLDSFSTLATDAPTSTTPDFSKCHCEFIQHEKLFKYLMIADQNGYQSIPYYRRLDLLQMGLYTNEQAKKCYQYCRTQSPSMSFSYTSKNMPTYEPGRHNSIEIVTGSINPEDMWRDRQHCYQTLQPRSIQATDRELCNTNYKPTEDSPQPSSQPVGLNVWMCCKRITPRGYY